MEGFICQSAAAGLLWLHEGGGGLCDDEGLSRFDRSSGGGFFLCGGGDGAKEGLRGCRTCSGSGVVAEAALEEGLNGAYGPNVVLVFPPLDEGDEPGGVQMCAVMTRR